ncbi:GRF-interacting factor 1-like isoform X1 [Zingiber officinale]|uniref:GRF-interacting factor 1-like isoform X1 n=1 Tax=Zingiber officinale TaxID=94328 RepID=UPI001C4D8103|nr:GRF-interacting factor 1-like isoform X1 [Zingiber officinale]XP_042383445.1 GRF-interacting factor 1-like isoform X1 [Zingiber officinale]
MQQHLMQMQPMMAAYASPNQVTTDIIQQVILFLLKVLSFLCWDLFIGVFFAVQWVFISFILNVGWYLDENKQLILAILDNQNTGKAEECAENQAKLQRNLMYLAAIADSQQAPTLTQFPPNSMMQSGPRYMPHQAAQQLTPQSLLAARTSMLYQQSPISSLQQQAALHGQLGASSGFNILHGEASVGFPDFGRGNSSKQEGGSALSTEGRGGNSARQSGDGTESLYLKGSEEEGN